MPNFRKMQKKTRTTEVALAGGVGEKFIKKHIAVWPLAVLSIEQNQFVVLLNLI